MGTIILKIAIAVGIFAFAMPAFAQQSLTTDEAIQYVELNPEIIEFAAEREQEPLAEVVAEWIAGQPVAYGSLLDRIRDRNRPPEDVEDDQRSILDKINDRRKKIKDAKTDLQVAKSEKWAAFAQVIYAAAFLAVVVFVGLLVLKIVNAVCKVMGWD